MRESAAIFELISWHYVSVCVEDFVLGASLPPTARRRKTDGEEKRREKSIKWGRRPYGQGEASPANKRGASQRSSQLIIPSGCFQLMGSSLSLRLPYINAPSTCEYFERIPRHLNSISSESVGALDGVPRLVAPLSFLKKMVFFLQSVPCIITVIVSRPSMKMSPGCCVLLSFFSSFTIFFILDIYIYIYIGV